MNLQSLYTEKNTNGGILVQYERLQLKQKANKQVLLYSNKKGILKS
jgi:hypothetical protein